MKFITYKRTKTSNWVCAEYSLKNNECIDSIAPDRGNHCKFILIDVSRIKSAIKEYDNGPGQYPEDDHCNAIDCINQIRKMLEEK